VWADRIETNTKRNKNSATSGKMLIKKFIQNESLGSKSRKM
jgi:hypothetical protein